MKITMKTFVEETPEPGRILVTWRGDHEDLHEQVDSFEPGDGQIQWAETAILLAQKGPMGGLRLWRDEGRGREINNLEYVQIAATGRWVSLDAFWPETLPSTEPHPMIVSGTGTTIWPDGWTPAKAPAEEVAS